MRHHALPVAVALTATALLGAIGTGAAHADSKAAPTTTHGSWSGPLAGGSWTAHKTPGGSSHGGWSAPLSQGNW